MKVKIFVLMILAVGLFQVNLFSFISSRIEGTIVDKDTGQPLVGAEVYLLRKQSDYIGKATPKRLGAYEWVKKTDSKGFFQFDGLVASEYYICVYKGGYELYGPKTKKELKEKTYSWFSGSIDLIPNSVKGRIYLKEGKIKHFKISLRKEAIVDVIFTKKTDKGESPLEIMYGAIKKENLRPIKYGASIELLESGNSGFKRNIILSPSRYETGKLSFDNLPGGQNVRISISAYLYPESTHDVYLKSGETTTFHYTLDFTSGPVVHGFIKRKDNPGYRFLISSIVLKGPEYRVDGLVEENGEFWIKGMNEGKCVLNIRVIKAIPGQTIENRFRVIKDKIVLDLEKDKRIELDLKY